MDAFSVSVACGTVYKRFHFPHALRLAGIFGFFQFAMPVIGWICGLTVKRYISPYQHWAGFLILTAIGCKMIYEAFKLEETEKKPMAESLPALFTLAVATSIDALAVGLTISLVTSHIWIAVAGIGVVTFMLSFAGFYMGTRFGHMFENKTEIFGGAVLIILGIKMLLH
ncbi:putative manganese efflux pump MntP [Limihaloglobus sulfuriphilus]|uniref:Putative manganese efflux pump MntP n=2 Tax=Limihaloglobus sulfuriphilus TaxID=1851148 RepID=A0A1Q2MCM9_9BACT|nr:putative manganese efflux pump MntP [Limihaloglobus sulfuriphilus]